MNKMYKKAFKVYVNTRLKEVDFHSEVTHPIYIQVIYRGRNLIFKSYNFDLLNSTKYRVGRKVPKIKDVVRFDEDVLSYITSFDEDIYSSVEQLQSAYNFFSADLCRNSEEAYRVQFYLLLKEIGYPSIANLIPNINDAEVFYDFMKDFFAIARNTIAESVVEAMDNYGQFYIYLYEFVLVHRRAPYFFLSVKEWITTDVKEEFRGYLSKIYPNKSDKIIIDVDRWVKKLEANI